LIAPHSELVYYHVWTSIKIFIEKSDFKTSLVKCWWIFRWLKLEKETRSNMNLTKKLDLLRWLWLLSYFPPLCSTCCRLSLLSMLLCAGWPRALLISCVSSQLWVYPSHYLRGWWPHWRLGYYAGTSYSHIAPFPCKLTCLVW
jgi:hypothetical protein